MIPSVDVPASNTAINCSSKQQQQQQQKEDNNVKQEAERVIIYSKSRRDDTFLVHVVDNDDDDDDDDENDEENDEEEEIKLNEMDSPPNSFNKSNLIIENETTQRRLVPKFIEKSVIIHKDENGFGLRFKGYDPVFVEHVHENGAAWRAGVRQFDTINKVNGIPVDQLSHKDVILMFKSCSKFVALTLLSSKRIVSSAQQQQQQHYLVLDRRDTPTLADNDQQHLGRRSSCTLEVRNQRQASMYSHRSVFIKSSSGDLIESRDRANVFVPNSRLNSSLLLTTESITARGVGSQSDLVDAEARTTTTQDSEPTTSGPQQQQQSQWGYDSSKSTSTKVGRRASNDSLENEKLARDKRLAVCADYESSSMGATPSSQDNTCSKGPQLPPSSSISRDRQNIHSFHSHRLRSDQQPTSPSSAKADEQRGLMRISRKSPGTSNQQHTENCSADTTLPGAAAISNYDKKRLIFKLSQSNSTNSLPAQAAATSTQPSGQQKPINAINRQATSATLVQPPQPPTAKVPMVVNKRLEIIKEFIDTERTHTERLRCLDELFYRPLKAGGLMTNEQLRMVFSCHRTLYRIHRQIYRILLSADCFKMYSEPLIGSALLEIFEGQLKKRLERAACSFCTAQATNIELLNKLTRRETKTGEFMAHVTSQQMVGRLGIKDLLASCFQRLTKYPLLLENLLRATPQAPSDDQLIEQHELSNSNALAESTELRVGGNNAGNATTDDDDDDHQKQQTAVAQLNSRRMFAISLAEEREFVERALRESREILVRVNEAIKVATSRQKLKEIWKRTDKHPGVPLIDITKQQLVHEGPLTLRLSKRSFDVYVLLLNDYLIILTREGQDKYRLKFFTPEGKSASSLNSAASSAAAAAAANNQQHPAHHHHHQLAAVYSPVFVIDEHLTTRDAATDENGFYLLCKRKDDSRIYEFASRSPAERIKWRDKIQWTIERQMSRHLMMSSGSNGDRRASCESTLTKSSSDISSGQIKGENEENDLESIYSNHRDKSKAAKPFGSNDLDLSGGKGSDQSAGKKVADDSNEPTKFVGTISYVDKDEIVLPSEMETYSANVNKAVQMNISD